MRNAARAEHAAEDDFADERDHAGDHHRDHQHAHVAVADVRQFMAEHRFQLGVIEALHEAARHRDRILLLIETGGESIERGVLDDLQLRHRNAARDAEIFQQIIKTRLLRCG
jgi:hypothetical protein